MTIIKWILTRLGMNVISAGGVWLLLALGAGLAAGGFWLGYEWADGQWSQQYAKALEQSLDERLELELDLAERDEQLLEVTNAKVIEYRTLYREIPAAVDPVSCSLTNDGLQRLDDQIRSANRRRGYDAAVRSSP